MIELVMTVCLLSVPDRCEQKHQQFTEVTLMQCTMGAMPYVAKWAEEHPGVWIQRWRCDVPGRKDQNA